MRNHAGKVSLHQSLPLVSSLSWNLLTLWGTWLPALPTAQKSAPTALIPHSVVSTLEDVTEILLSQTLPVPPNTDSFSSLTGSLPKSHLIFKVQLPHPIK